jgi:DNA-binding beta-propeller fold protein YncE
MSCSEDVYHSCFTAGYRIHRELSRVAYLDVNRAAPRLENWRERSKAVMATLDAKIFGANRLKFTPDGKLVLVSSLRDGDLVIYDAASHKEFKRASIGHGAAGILMYPDGSRAFIACSPDNYIAILDLKTLQVTGHLDVGGEPDGLAWAVRP